MPTYKTVHRVQHSAEKMFEIVSDIERYPEFLPLCEQLTIIKKDSENNEEGKELESRYQQLETLEADMTIGYKAITQTFRSKVSINKKDKTIKTENIGGPFKNMHNEWAFTALDENSSDIHFQIDYAFKNWALEKLMGAVFDEAIRTYTQSFENRANTI